jgi:uncharacterized protein YbgA (DUF1722 family)
VTVVIEKPQALSFMVMHFLGHFSAQSPQPTHLSGIIECFSRGVPPLTAENLQTL